MMGGKLMASQALEMQKVRKTNVKALICCVVIGLALIGKSTEAASLHLRVTTDKEIYIVGEEVNWTIWAWASVGDNRGVATIDVSLNDNRNEELNPAFVVGTPPNDELEDTEYGLEEHFTLVSSGTRFPTPPRLRRMNVYQNDLPVDIGNDGVEHIFAKGKYIVTKTGPHDLNIFLNHSSYYWTDAVGNFDQFTPGENHPAYMTVITDPNIDGVSVVDFNDFALMANEWERTDCNAANDWCTFTDLDQDNNVDFFEVQMIALHWLE